VRNKLQGHLSLLLSKQTFKGLVSVPTSVTIKVTLTFIFKITIVYVLRVSSMEINMSRITWKIKPYTKGVFILCFYKL